MRRKIFGLVGAAVVVTALLAGCTSGSGSSGGGAGATLGPSTPLKSSAPAKSAPATSAAASVSSVSPATGGVVGGQTVTLHGSGLSGVDAVTFNGVAATSVKAVSSSSVTAVVPNAVNFQASTGAVVASVASKPVATTAKYSWTVSSGVDREMQYAFSHWSAATYNASYTNFNAVGGDCQNFVSQSLFARGLKQTASWFYNSSGSHSESWGYAPSFDNLLKTTPSLGFTPLASTQRSQLSVGDLAYFDWNDNDVPDHVMIVSGVSTVNGVTKVSLVGHNLDYDYRDLDTTITKDHPGAKVWFYKVPASL